MLKFKFIGPKRLNYLVKGLSSLGLSFDYFGDKI